MNCYHFAIMRVLGERSDRDTPANFGTMPRCAGVSVDVYGFITVVDSHGVSFEEYAFRIGFFASV